MLCCHCKKNQAIRTRERSVDGKLRTISPPEAQEKYPSQELCMDIFILVLGLIGLAMWKELGIILLLLDAIMWGVTVWGIWLENKREEESVRLEQEIAELKKQIEILNNSIYDEK